MPRTCIAIAAFAAAILLAGAMTEAAAQHSSTTRHKYAGCASAPSPEPDVIDVRRCKGPSGIAVQWMSEPDSTSVSFGDKPMQEYLELGAAFEVGPAIEWRSPSKGARPVAAIVRYKAGDRIGKLDRNVLVVYRLEPKGGSCVMAVVGGAEADEKARKLADAQAPSFVCGKTQRISP